MVGNWFSRGPAEKDWEVLMDQNLNLTQCNATAKKISKCNFRLH